MNDYFDMPVIQKLFEFQKDYLENQLIDKSIELKNADKEEYESINKVTKRLKEMLSEDDYKCIENMMERCEVTKFKHEDLMCYIFYRLGIKDGFNICDFCRSKH